MAQDLTLHQRRRAPTPQELQDIPWLNALTAHERAQTMSQLVVGDALAGDVVCRIGNQLNERLGQFIAAREIDRINNPDLRVARNLAALVNPVLFPGVGRLLNITQQELGYLVGLSRQRVNVALKRLEQAQWISVSYGGIQVLDLAALRSHTLPDT